MPRNQKHSKNNNYRETDNEKIRYLYLNQGLSMTKIGSMMGTDHHLIRRRLEWMGISQRDFNEQVRLGIHQNIQKFINASSGKRNPAFRHGRKIGQKQNRKEYLKAAKEHHPWICMSCGCNNTKMDLIVHHKDGNIKNNHVMNLMVLCQSCHARLHMSRRQESKQRCMT